jgi:hypothetical protein
MYSNDIFARSTVKMNQNYNCNIKKRLAISIKDHRLESHKPFWKDNGYYHFKLIEATKNFFDRLTARS